QLFLERRDPVSRAERILKRQAKNSHGNQEPQQPHEQMKREEKQQEQEQRRQNQESAAEQPPPNSSQGRENIDATNEKITKETPEEKAKKANFIKPRATKGEQREKIKSFPQRR